MSTPVVKRPKARTAAECRTLEQLPNVGPAVAADLRRLGIGAPQQLAGRDAVELYRALERLDARRPDPCVLDTLLAVTDFMRGAPPAPWWHYTAERKRRGLGTVAPPVSTPVQATAARRPARPADT